MKTSTTTKSKLLGILRGVGVALFWLIVWEVAARAVDLELLLPSPTATVHKLISLMSSGSYWTAIATSLLRILIGYTLGCVVGTVMGFLLYRFSLINVLFSPVLSMIRSVPVASFIILALVWIGRDNIPPFIAFLMVFPVISSNVKTGFQSVDRELAEVATVYHFSRRKQAELLYKPAVIPYFMTAAHVTLGLAWKAGVAAEILASLSKSIGGNIYTSKVQLETDTLFAWTITVILISILFEFLLTRFMDKVKPREGGAITDARDPS